MKSLKKIVFIWMSGLFCFSSFGYETKSFQGQITNYTKADFEEITITYGLTCLKPGVYESKRCGENVVKVKPNDFGEFTVPSLRVKTSFLKRRYIHAWFSISINDKYIGNSTPETKNSSCYFDPDCSYRVIKSKMRNLSVIELPPLKINSIFKSGISAQEFYSYFSTDRLKRITKSTIALVSFVENGENHKIIEHKTSLLSSLLYVFESSLDIFFITKQIQGSDKIQLNIRSQYTGCARFEGGYTEVPIEYSVAEGYSFDGDQIEVLDLKYNDISKSGSLSCASN